VINVLVLQQREWKYTFRRETSMNAKRIITWAKHNKVNAGILVFFLVWMLFFDEYNWVRMFRDKRNLHELKENQQFYKAKIQDDRKKLHNLKDDPDALEKFAREEYFLKKPNEEVYIIVEKK
jgi:cell division protein DivIC